MKVALIHDYLNQYGGAERVLDELHEMWPDAPVYTSVYDPARMPPRYRSWDIRTSLLNRLPNSVPSLSGPVPASARRILARP